jgi:hypothetical protein
MVALAVATGIAPSVWAGETDEAIVTALEILTEQAEEARSNGR